MENSLLEQNEALAETVAGIQEKLPGVQKALTRFEEIAIEMREAGLTRLLEEREVALVDEIHAVIRSIQLYVFQILMASRVEQVRE